jgi:hypothetical protein
MPVCYKTRPDVHLIVTCTRRKTVAAGDGNEKLNSGTAGEVYA